MTTTAPAHEYHIDKRLRVDGYILVIRDRPDLTYADRTVVFEVLAPPLGAGIGESLREEDDGRVYGVVSPAELDQIATPAAAQLPVPDDRVVLYDGLEADVLENLGGGLWRLLDENGRHRTLGVPDGIVGYADGTPADLSDVKVDGPR